MIQQKSNIEQKHSKQLTQPQKQKHPQQNNLQQQSITTNIQKPQQNTTKIAHKLFSVATDVGTINIEIISLQSYKWIIITQSTTLKIDGSFQLAMKTAFQNKPTVLDIGADQHQASTDDFCSKLSKNLGSPIVLSMNLDPGLTINDQRNIIQFLTNTFNQDLNKEQKTIITTDKQPTKDPFSCQNQSKQK